MIIFPITPQRFPFYIRRTIKDHALHVDMYILPWLLGFCGFINHGNEFYDMWEGMERVSLCLDFRTFGMVWRDYHCV